jgi:hypothetical protein
MRSHGVVAAIVPIVSSAIAVAAAWDRAPGQVGLELAVNLTL